LNQQRIRVRGRCEYFTCKRESWRIRNPRKILRERKGVQKVFIRILVSVSDTRRELFALARVMYRANRRAKSNSRIRILVQRVLMFVEGGAAKKGWSRAHYKVRQVTQWSDPRGFHSPSSLVKHRPEEINIRSRVRQRAISRLARARFGLDERLEKAGNVRVRFSLFTTHNWTLAISILAREKRLRK